jgi:hypothetical protein
MLHKRTGSGPTVWRRNAGAVPLHIPKEGRYIFNSPHANGLRYLKAELERLSVLGSTWASCALDGYVSVNREMASAILIAPSSCAKIMRRQVTPMQTMFSHGH